MLAEGIETLVEQVKLRQKSLGAGLAKVCEVCEVFQLPVHGRQLLYMPVREEAALGFQLHQGLEELTVLVRQGARQFLNQALPRERLPSVAGFGANACYLARLGPTEPKAKPSKAPVRSP